ncbi:UNVERIFIED_CONTAM: hypothetical protein FKN15_059603 [Acipenser sinensis]
MQDSPVLMGAVPYLDSVDTCPECPDLPPLSLVPRSQHCQAQFLAWSFAPLHLETQTSLRKRQTLLVFPLLLAAFPLPTALLPPVSKTLLRRSTATYLCLSLLAPRHLHLTAVAQGKPSGSLLSGLWSLSRGTGLFYCFGSCLIIVSL